MSDSKKNSGMPHDDFSKTTPNIPRPKNDFGSNDWEKTNYNAGGFAPQPPADDWGKTVANVPPIKNEPDFNKTYLPSQNQSPKAPEWGMTEANIRLPNDDFGAGDVGNRTAYGATTPFIQLPDAERAKYQNLPPTPTEAAARQKEEEKKGGIPAWFWVSAGILTMFFFTVLAGVLVYYFFLRPTGFEVVVQSAPPRSEIWVDGTKWNLTEGDGNISAKGLKSGDMKKIEIRNANFTCESRDIKGNPGESVVITARCTAKAAPTPQPPTDDCQNIKKGEFDKAERCANLALDSLKEPFTAEDVAKALNLYIINFASGKYDIPDKNLAFLEKASNYLKKLPPSTVIEVGGHTDDVGSDANNLTLSNNRAKSVREALVNKFGVSKDMLQEKGYGETKPKSTNDTEDGKFQNRRIEYSVLKK